VTETVLHVDDYEGAVHFHTTSVEGDISGRRVGAGSMTGRQALGLHMS
jgi:hypothetical protein